MPTRNPVPGQAKTAAARTAARTAGAGAATSAAGLAAAAAPVTPAPTNGTAAALTTPAGALTPDEQNTNAAADVQIQQFLASTPGLGTLDAASGGAFSQWLIGQVGTLAGQGNTDPWTTIQNIINNPAQYGDAQAQQVFDAAFPGYNQRIANGYSNTGPAGAGLAGYIAYASQIQSIAAGINLTPGTVTPQMIGNAWAGDVSPTEFSDRLTTGYAEALQAVNNVPGFSDYMLHNYGVTTADLASYYLNPANSEAVLQNQFNQASVYAGAKQVGLGELNQAQASEVANFLATSAGGGMSQAGTGNVTAAGAAGFLSQNIQGTGASAAELSPYASNPTAASEQNLGVNQLLGAETGNAQDILATQQAVGSRTAGAKGGGGFTTTAQGAEGIGFAQS